METYTATEFTAINKDGRLTPAELETLAWMSEGKENAAIGILRGHGTPGAKKLVSNVMIKFSANTRCLAVARACMAGFVVAVEHPRHLAAAMMIMASGWVGTSLPDADVYRRNNTRSSSVRIGPRGPGRLELNLNNWLGAA